MSLPPVPCALWTTPEEVRKCCGGLSDDYDLTDAIRFASAILFRLSGRRWPGVCERTVRPCRGSNCGCSGRLGATWNYVLGGYPSLPYPVDGGFVNCWQDGGVVNACGSCSGGCSLDCVELPAVVDSVTSVVIDGEVLPPSAYRVEAHRRLCRVDGGSWPCSNDLTQPSCETADTMVAMTVTGTGTWDVTVGSETVTITADATPETVLAALSSILGDSVTVGGSVGSYAVTVDVDVAGPIVFTLDGSGLTDGTATQDVVNPGCVGAPGTWEITYERGPAPPPDGALSAAIFACEVARDRCGAESCLPRRLKEINREGVTMAFADPLEFLDEGKVGIYMVDMWLTSVNPNRLQRSSSIHRATAPRAPRRWL